MRFRLAIVPVALSLSACASAPYTYPFASKLEPKVHSSDWSAPLNKPLSVEVGEPLFIDGKVRVSFLPGLRMSAPISSTMPGGMGIHFNFEIARGDLPGKYRRGEFEFYCADAQESEATFAGRSVVVDGDCVGVMRNSGTGELRWVVDNSEFNKQTTVWSRPVTPADGVTLDAYEFPAGDRVTAQRFVFDGMYSGLLHFTLRGGERNGTEFKFDFPSRSGDNRYGALGYVFEVLEVSNTTLRYRWLSIPSKDGE